MKRIATLWIALFCAIISMAAPHTVTAKVLNLRTEPSTSAAVGTALMKGATVEVVAIEGEWAQVEHEGKTYWAAAQYLEPAADVVPASEPVDKESAFLATLKSWNLPDMVANNSNVPFYAALTLLVIFALVQIIGGADAYDKPGAFYAGAAGFLTLCVLEIVHFAGYRGDVTWFCSPDKVGWLWTVINFLLFGYFCYVQIVTYIILNSMVHYHGRRSCDVRVGLILTLVALGAFIVSALFFEQYNRAVIIIDAVGLAAWLGWIVWCNVRDGGSWLNLPLAMVLWVVGVSATLVVLFNFIVMLILVLVAGLAGWFVLKMVGSSSSSSSSGVSSTTQPEEKRTFLEDSYGNKIEVEESAFSDTATEKGVIGGRKFEKGSDGNWYEK